jgi:hypothetical protein
VEAQPESDRVRQSFLSSSRSSAGALPEFYEFWQRADSRVPLVFWDSSLSGYIRHYLRVDDIPIIESSPEPLHHHSWPRSRPLCAAIFPDMSPWFHRPRMRHPHARDAVPEHTTTSSTPSPRRYAPHAIPRACSAIILHEPATYKVCDAVKPAPSLSSQCCHPPQAYKATLYIFHCHFGPMNPDFDMLHCHITLICYIAFVLLHFFDVLHCHIALICYIACNKSHCFDMLHCFWYVALLWYATLPHCFDMLHYHISLICYNAFVRLHCFDVLHCHISLIYYIVFNMSHCFNMLHCFWYAALLWYAT